MADLLVSHTDYYAEMAENHELFKRSAVAQIYRVAAFAYVREALNEYLEKTEEERARGEPLLFMAIFSSQVTFYSLEPSIPL